MDYPFPRWPQNNPPRPDPYRDRDRNGRPPALDFRHPLVSPTQISINEQLAQIHRQSWQLSQDFPRKVGG
jgi:hypothetical protein